MFAFPQACHIYVKIVNHSSLLERFPSLTLFLWLFSYQSSLVFLSYDSSVSSHPEIPLLPGNLDVCPVIHWVVSPTPQLQLSSMSALSNRVTTWLFKFK